jgi:hypothetical protein
LQEVTAIDQAPAVALASPSPIACVASFRWCTGHLRMSYFLIGLSVLGILLAPGRSSDRRGGIREGAFTS